MESNFMLERHSSLLHLKTTAWNSASPAIQERDTNLLGINNSDNWPNLARRTVLADFGNGFFAAERFALEEKLWLQQISKKSILQGINRRILNEVLVSEFLAHNRASRSASLL